MKRALVLSFGLFALACSATPPAHWAQGGAPLDIPHARWIRGDAVIDILPDGRILVDNEHQYTIDRAGRVYDIDKAPVALLEVDGRVVGPDNTSLGQIGSLFASLPDEQQAWLGVTPAGEVVRFNSEGERSSMGAWVGECPRSASSHEVCVLVSHLLGMKIKDRGRRPYGGGGVPMMTPGFGPGVGVGIGVGVGVP